ncbi:GNAT family N-acetyltransferase [Cellulomonas hominis]
MSPAPTGYRVVEVPESRKPELVEIDQIAFSYEPDAETRAQVPLGLDWDRTVGVETDAGELVAVHASYPFTLPVPGGEVPCAGLTWVGVRPDHRRRRLLSSMIAAHVDRSLARGEVVSALFAAEPGIYGRFGYGSASDNVRLTLRRGAALRDVEGSADLGVRFVTADRAAHLDLVQRLHVAAGAGRPGWITRPTPDLRVTALADPPAWREGGEPLRLATVHGPDGEPRAYALLRRKDVWTERGAEFTVTVREAAALDAASAHRLWSFLLDLDLTSTVRTPMLAVDDPLLHQLVDVRRGVAVTSDNLWVRLLDVPAALAARRYSAPLDVVLDVRDERVPANAGSWRLVTGAQSGGAWAARVKRAEPGAPADVHLDVRELGALYLGGRSLVAQAAAGLVTGSAAALQATAAAFTWPVAPLCSWVF